MMARIDDGAGTGNVAKVDSTNRLLVEGVALSIGEEAVLGGVRFEVGAALTLTGTAETAVIFLENQQEKTLIIDRFEFAADQSTGGTSDAMALKLYTGATGITSSTPSQSVNSNFGSSLVLNADVQVGNGSTSAVTGGNLFGVSYIRFLGQSVFDGPWAMPRGTAFALTVTPPASNTSLPFSVRVLTHLERSE